MTERLKQAQGSSDKFLLSAVLICKQHGPECGFDSGSKHFDIPVFLKEFFEEEKTAAEDKNISILYLSCRTSDLQFSLILQTYALVL